MARKDERGVVIPAPLQFNNPATASLPRYDDEHRGPAVTDSYELSHCRIDLAERSEAWPAPANLPPRMVEFAQSVPGDQRADWLRRQANVEEADRHISNAMRSGELPIWVAPIGEPERLVAPGAMVEVDQATVVSGVYRPPNDRGWLYGRPLFVKRDDWAKFAARIDASKKPVRGNGRTQSRSPEGDQKQWLRISKAIRILHRILRTRLAGQEPASWVYAPADPFDAECENATHRHRRTVRTSLTMRRALLSGDLTAHLVKDGASQLLPGWAWENGGAAENAFNFDWLPLNPLLRHGMQELADWRCFVSRADFKAWVAGSEVADIGNLPALPAPVGYEARPDLLSYREPPDRPFIELTHALTWIAFAISLSREEFSFMEPFQFGPFAKSGWTDALRAGMADLADQASAGNIRVRGRSIANYSDRSAAAKVDTAYLSDTQLRDFACFDGLHGGLMHGAGLAVELDWFSHVFDGRRDGWHDLEVCRADLIKAFPLRVWIMLDGGQSVAPLPLSCNEPAIIAPWWSVSEALAWVATRQPDFVAFIGNRVRRESEIGTLLSHFMFEQDVAAVQSQSVVAEFWPGASTLAQAGRALLAQILSGAVKPRTRGAIVAVEIFVGTGLDPTGADWLDLDPQPLFSSEEVIRAFSAIGLDPAGDGGVIAPDNRRLHRVNKSRKKPGPAPDPDWPPAIAKVTQECIAAGYKRTGKRGQKAAIQTMLLSYMADKDKHFSLDAAAKHAEKVIAALPDN